MDRAACVKVSAQVCAVARRYGHQIIRFLGEQDCSRAVVAFILSFVLVVTVGMMIFPNTARTLKPKPSAGPVSVTPSLDVLPGLPSLAVPRVSLSSKRSEDAANLSAASAMTSERDLKVGSVSEAPPVFRQATAVAARPSGSVRGGFVWVTGITLWGTPSRPWISITASAPVGYQLRNVEPDWVVIDVSRAQLALASGKLPEGRGVVRRVRAGQFAPDVVRVVLELTEPIPVHVATSPDKTAIVLSLVVQAPGNGSVPPTSPLLAQLMK